MYVVVLRRLEAAFGGTKPCMLPAGVVEVLPSLLDFKPAAYGLPPFDDELAGAVVLDPPWHIKGTVVKGFGRGSKVNF